MSWFVKSRRNLNSADEDNSTVERTEEVSIDEDKLRELAEETAKFRIELAEHWINNERLVKLLDLSADGYIDYDSFYDGVSQFGLTESVNVEKVFEFIDKKKEGKITSSQLLEAIKLRERDVKAVEDHHGSAVDGDEFDPFSEDLYPETLLVALVAHNEMKPSMMVFVKENLEFFKKVKIVTTGSTGRALSSLGITVDSLVSSGPLGGDQEIGGMIAQGLVAAVFFFTDPLSSHPHNADIIALNRICCVHDTMFANNPSTANALIYSLEYSAYGYARLVGANPDYLKGDTDIVKNYKNSQKQVIKKVSHQKSVIHKSSLDVEKLKASTLHVERGGASKASQGTHRSSVVFAPRIS